mgnify:FL=1
MGGPSSSGGGDTGPANRYSTPKKKVVDFIKDGGVTGMVVRAISGQIEKSKAKAKDRKINDTYLGSPDYQGDVSKKPTKVTTPVGGNDNDNNPPPKVETKKSTEQPKVKSQMNNSEVKSDLITATGPTDIEMANTTEMSEEEKLIKRKRGKKTKTILSSVTGDNSQATLSQKTLLG